MTTGREVIWIGKDNTIDLLLKAGGVTQNRTSVTDVKIVFSGMTISSSVSPLLFSGVTDSSGATLTLKLGKVGGLVAGTFDAKLILYDSTNDSGIVWGEIPLVVKS